jgi:hypothetical protein
MHPWMSRPELTPPETTELLKAQASARGEPVTWDYGVAERLVSRRFLRAVGAVCRKVAARPAYEITREGRMAIASLA